MVYKIRFLSWTMSSWIKKQISLSLPFLPPFPILLWSSYENHWSCYLYIYIDIYQFIDKVEKWWVNDVSIITVVYLYLLYILFITKCELWFNLLIDINNIVFFLNCDKNGLNQGVSNVDNINFTFIRFLRRHSSNGETLFLSWRWTSPPLSIRTTAPSSYPEKQRQNSYTTTLQEK